MSEVRPLRLQSRFQDKISIDDARRIAVRSQWLTQNRPQAPSVYEVVERLGCLQIDALQAVRRSHELVLLSRGVSVAGLDRVHTMEAGLFETWGHAHSLLPQSMWPLMRWRRELIARRGLSGPPLNRPVAAEILKRIEVEGPSTLSELGKNVGRGWERTSPAKTACEWLLSTGELAVVDRDARWKRIYRTPQQAGLPDPESVTSEESLRRTILVALDALGIATVKDVRDYFRIPRDVDIASVADSAGYERVWVEGNEDAWFVDPVALRDLPGNQSRDSLCVTVLSPFDSLIWTRSRQADLFGKNYVLEAYKPSTAREFGYFSMPILLGHRLVGRVAARVKSGVVEIENFECDVDVCSSEIRSAAESQLSGWTSLRLDETKLVPGVSS